MVLPLSGPEFWDHQFGIASFDEFKPLATQYLGGFGVFGLQFPNEVLAQIAYNSPYSALGLYIGGRIAASGYVGTDQQQSTTDVINSLQPFVVGDLLGRSAVAGLVIPNCFQVAIQFTDSGHAMENVIGVENASGTAAGAAAAVKAAWEVAAGPHSLRSSSTTMVNYHAVDISSLSGTIADLASTTAGGAGAGPLSTRGAAALVKWNGSSRARSTRGRIYTGPLREAEINNDGATLASAAITALNTAFTNFRNSLGTAGYPLVVLSRKTSTATVVTQHSVESTIATQRRRIRV